MQAWVELAELVGDPTFRARCREMAVAGSSEPVAPEGYDPALVLEHAGAALRSGVDPGSPRARPVLDRIGAAELDAPARAALAGMIETFSDRRVERYWALLGTLNGWPESQASVPAFEWFAAALRAR